ncbi:MAG TPA: hypothetical protein VGP63_26885 [Planctomycetaceae bacterium]|jgi:hypothetical protein|nr:hypothetical protein [Planctomycetaceae bacterium]
MSARGLCLSAEDARYNFFAMFFNDEQERQFRAAWESISIRRRVSYSLFTFGESLLPYFLVLSASRPGQTVSLTRGEVRIARPTIVTPQNASPEFQNFFDSDDNAEVAQFLLARTAGFSHLKLTNASGPKQIQSDSVEEVVNRLNRQLDDEEEDHTAILTAPPELAGIALLRYAAERVWSSASDNIQELRERGFLP